MYLLKDLSIFLNNKTMITDKYNKECVFCGERSDQADFIQWCIVCKRPLVAINGNIDWHKITIRLLKTLERGEINEMTLIGVINYIARQPEFQNLSEPVTDSHELIDENAFYAGFMVGWLNDSIPENELEEFKSKAYQSYLNKEGK